MSTPTPISPSAAACPWTRVILPVVLLTLAAYAAIGLVAVPMTDDYMFTNNAREQGPFGAMWHLYTTWSGRYTAHVVLFSYYYFGHMDSTYGLLPLTLILGLCTGAWMLVSAGGWGRLWARAALAPALLLVALYLTHAPAPPEVLYWFAGAFNYTLPNLLLLAVGGLVLLPPPPGATRHPRWQQVAVVVVTIVAYGGNESNLFFVSGALGLGALLATWLKHPQARLWWLAVAGGVVGAALMLGAPGNWVRQQAFNPDRSVLGALSFAYRYTGERLADWLTSPAWWGLVLLAAPAIGPWAARQRWHAALTGPRLLALALLLLAMLGAVYFPVIYGTSWEPPPRIHDTASFFSLLVLCTLALLTIAWGHQPRRRPRRAPAWLLAAFCVAGLLLGPKSGWRTCVYELVAVAPSYHQQMQTRLEAIAQARADHTPLLIVPRLRPAPTTIHTIDITNDPQHGINKNVARYYGITAVATDSPTNYAPLKVLWK